MKKNNPVNPDSPIVLITGGAKGIGKIIAESFAERDSIVIAADVLYKSNSTSINAQDMGTEKQIIIPFYLDVTIEENWEKLVQEIRKTFGRLDVLINNAGINSREAFEDYPVAAWDRVMAVNVKGVFLGIKHCLPLFKKSKIKSIINISSVAGQIGHKFTPPAYIASKGAVNMLTKAIAVQYAYLGIRANSINPSTVNTDFMRILFKDKTKEKERLDEIPLGRLCSETDVAKTALFLALDGPSFITGVNLPVDGGLSSY